MNYLTLEDEYDATIDEMIDVSIEVGDEVLYTDEKNVFKGIVNSIECYSGRYTPPTYFYEIENENGVVGVEAEYVIKRKV